MTRLKRVTCNLHRRQEHITLRILKPISGTTVMVTDVTSKLPSLDESLRREVIYTAYITLIYNETNPRGDNRDTALARLKRVTIYML